MRDSLIRDLSELYPGNESRNIIDWLIESITGIEKHDLITDPEKLIDDKTKTVLMSKFRELMRSRPVQYVTGRAFFHGFEFEVDESVLIPRPETEELVKWIADENRHIPGLHILDVGTGSACIAITLGKLLKRPVLTAIDISANALVVAKKNAELHNTMIDFRRVDIFHEQDWQQFHGFDLIVSNPPYVRESEKKEMKENVTSYEPHLALFVPDEDPLRYYHAIADIGKVSLNQGGRIYAEINENLGNETRDVFIHKGYRNVLINKDLRGRDRMIRAGF